LFNFSAPTSVFQVVINGLAVVLLLELTEALELIALLELLALLLLEVFTLLEALDCGGLSGSPVQPAKAQKIMAISH
jgi:hypothetical protein